MPSELDRRYDAAVAAVTGTGGRIEVGPDPETGLPIALHLPPTLPTLFDIFCALHGDMEALIAGDERLTFKDLNAEATRLARALVGAGLAKGDRIGIAMRNCPAWVVTWMAVLKAGGVATLINGWWQREEMQHALALTAPTRIFADERRGALFRAAGCTIPLDVLSIERPIADAIAPLIGTEEADLPIVLPTDDATILFTSGSTGPAKGAVSTHRAVTTGVYSFAMGLAALLALREAAGNPPKTPPRTLINVPLFHVTGEVPVLLNSFVVGRTMVMMPKWDAGEALRLIEKEKITYFVGVPMMSMELMQHPDRDKYDLSTLSDIAAGGAPRPVSHVGRLEKAFPAAQPGIGYGLTETNAVGCMNFWSNYHDKPASTGRPTAPFVDLAILGADGKPLPAGEIGEIAIRSAANIRGYWGDEAATRACITPEGYVLSGDVGYLDADNYLFIVDRKKDIIIRGGENISAAEVENAIYAHPAVSEASVFGVPDDRLGEVPVAVVHSENGGIDAESLREFLETRLAKFKIPAAIRFSPKPLPRLGTGKIDRMALKAAWRDEAGAVANA